MTNLTRLLREADPAREEEGLSSADAHAIRRRMLATVRESSSTLPAWQRPLAVAAVVALMVGVGSVAGHRMVERDAISTTSALVASLALAGGGSPGGSERRQLQFATPGGTRIIWIFDQNLRLQESMP